MIIRSASMVALVLVHATTVNAQVVFNDARWDSAYVAWDQGQYPEALNRLRTMLSDPAAMQYLKSAALLTGEWFRTTEVAAPDRFVIRIAPASALPRWSADGRYFLFEQSVDGAVRTHLFDATGASPKLAAELPGTSLDISPDSRRAVYIRVPQTAELRKARENLSRARTQPDAARARAALSAIERRTAEVVVRDLRNGEERVIAASGISAAGASFGSDGAILLTGSRDEAASELFRVAENGAVAPVAGGIPVQAVLTALADGRVLVATGQNTYAVLDTRTGASTRFTGLTPDASADGRKVAYLARNQGSSTISVIDVMTGSTTVVKESAVPLLNPVLSPDGSRVAYQVMPREDWELYVIGSDGSDEKRVTREIQHDHTPKFLTNDRLLGVIGENRHRRSYIYDLNTLERTRLFHNNTIRTVSMEYAWTPSPDGSKIVIVADRDGDTISPERGVYVTDLNATISTQELLDRVARMATVENELRMRGEQMFAPVAQTVRTVLSRASVSRVYGYENALFRFDSKHITQPGNQKAIEYIAAMLRSWGYDPELQWFEARGVRTANVIATLPGTVNPELVYVVSSHFDSVERGPGADDDTSGTAALLEAARIMAETPMPATIKFAFFTGEEAGLLGSREFVRRAVAAGDRIVGALNNDMIGYANDNRLDNTIRYSSIGLRDLQHAAAMLFTSLITYDSKYYQNTDAHAYYEAYGDIVGGIGSYPILGNPHYHQSHDVLETINHQLVTEVGKTTVASLIAMASSPSRIAGLQVARSGDRVQASWTPSPERGVTGYLVTWGPAANPTARTTRVTSPNAILNGVAPGSIVAVRAIHETGLQSWDWARANVR